MLINAISIIAIFLSITNPNVVFILFDFRCKTLLTLVMESILYFISLAGFKRNFYNISSFQTKVEKVKGHNIYWVLEHTELHYMRTTPK